MHLRNSDLDTGIRVAPHFDAKTPHFDTEPTCLGPCRSEGSSCRSVGLSASADRSAGENYTNRARLKAIGVRGGNKIKQIDF